MSLQESLAGTLSAFRLLNVFRNIPAITNRTFVVLGYHRIATVLPDQSYLFDPDLISATTAEFDWQMSFVNRECSILPLHELLARAQSNRPIPPRAVAVTFDDGFSDNHDIAFSILKKYSIPATMFVSTEWIDQQLPIWFEACAYACMRLPAHSLVVAGLPAALPVAADFASRRASTRQLLIHLKLISNAARVRAVADVLGQIVKGGFESDWRTHSAPLTWDKIRLMSRHHIDFGSHSVTHPILSRTSTDQISHELTHSRRRLQEEMDRPIELLAYPIGDQGAFDDRVVTAARAAGYRYGISYIAGANRQRQFDPFAVRRHHVETDVSRARFEAQLSLPHWFK